MHHPTYQSTGGGVPEVQLPAAHVDPDPFPPDGVVGIDVLVGCIGQSVCCVDWGRSLAHFNAAILSSLNNASDRHFVYAFSGESGNNISHANSFLSSFVASAAAFIVLKYR